MVAVPTDEQLRDNRAALEAPWAPDDSIEPLWLRIRDIVAFALTGGDAISNGTVIRATKKVLQDTGVFTRFIDLWDDKEAADKTCATFQTHFEKANHRRLETMTAADAGFGGGHAVTAPAPVVTTGRGYCWTHGYCLSSSHTSRTCMHKATGHRDDATIDNMFGGNNTIMRHRNEPAVYRPTRNVNKTNRATTSSN